jgi:hypothetical protein
MKVYKTSNWRDIVELEAIQTDDNNIWLAPTNLNSKYSFENSVRKFERKNERVQFWNTIEEAKSYLTEKLNAEILKYEKQILKAKAKIKVLM